MFSNTLDIDGPSPAQSNKAKPGQFPLLLVIIAIGVILSLVSYTYFLSISTKIDETVRDDLRRQARIEAFQITQLLQNELQVVSTSTMTAASRSVILNGNTNLGADIINAMQIRTPEITDRYFWLDQNGKTVWSSAFAGNQEQYDLYKGFDVSDRPYFVNPANTKEPYLSPIIQSPVDKNQRMFIAYPILDDGNFEGVIAASIRADSLGQLVQSKLSSEIQSSIGLIDPNGVIIYSSSSEFIGENLFGERVQSALGPAFASQEELTEFNDFLKASIEGGSDSRDFSAITGERSTVTYMPILTRTSPVDTENPSDGIQGLHFLTLYLVAPHDIASIIEPLVEQQRNFSLAVIATIAAVTIVISYVFLTWNKRLDRIVHERTASLKEANEQLKIHDKMQTEFINIAAHELRTPVQPLLNIAEQLEEDLEKGLDEIKVSRPEIEMLTRNAKRLVQLTSDVLEVTRIESNALTLHKQEVDLKEKLRHVIEDSKALIQDGRPLDIVFEDASGEGRLIVDADKSRLFEVLSNLIRNAIKFTPTGVITLRLEQKDGDAVVSVKDTGTGIDPSISPVLFEKFRSKSETGTGLGLYITKSIVEAHGGKIWAANNPDGKGATFTFTLPMLINEKAETTTN